VIGYNSEQEPALEKSSQAPDLVHAGDDEHDNLDDSRLEHSLVDLNGLGGQLVFLLPVKLLETDEVLGAVGECLDSR
jgi:hypothetical protein